MHQCVPCLPAGTLSDQELNYIVDRGIAGVHEGGGLGPSKICLDLEIFWDFHNCSEPEYESEDNNS